MELETYTVALLVTNPGAPDLAGEAAAELQDAHLSHLADLHASGELLAAGPLDDPTGELRGLSLLRGDPQRARELKDADPAVRAGVFVVRTLAWRTPVGALHFTPTRMPRSVADVLRD